MSVSLLDDEQLCYPGHPNRDQLDVLESLADEDEDAVVIGWHYPTSGPLLVRGSGQWQAISPSGVLRDLVASV